MIWGGAANENIDWYVRCITGRLCDVLCASVVLRVVTLCCVAAGEVGKTVKRTVERL